MPASEIMRKFHAGTLKTGSGKKVTSLRQAKAIAANYERKEQGEKAKPASRPVPHRTRDFFLKTGV